MVKYIMLVLLIPLSSLFCLDCSIYAARREAVREHLGPSSVMIIFTSPVVIRNGDVEYEWRPDSDYWYLTRHPEPKSCLILTSNHSDIICNQFTQELLFTRPRNPHIEVWTGKRLGIKGVKSTLNLNYVTTTDSLKYYLDEILPQVDTLFLNRRIPKDECNIPDFLIDMIANGTFEVLFAGEIILPLRHIKSQNEITLLKKAVTITGHGLEQAIRRVKPGLTENQIEATIEFIFREEGSERTGFPSIIGSGPNSTILHYTKNDRLMHKGDMLLMDVGAEYQMYTADITRTIPVSGKFTEEQEELYLYVLEAQKLAFDSVRVGMTLMDLHKIAKRYLDNVGFGQYFIHFIGHWLGLDAHDAGSYKSEIQVGTVFTIEPGIYISYNDTTADEKYRGIGIRIEDDILMTEDGPILLSKNILKDVKDIEALMRRRPKRRM